MSYPVIITYSNYGYIDFAKNFIINITRKSPNHKVNFYCLDKKIYEELSQQFSGYNNIKFLEWFQEDSLTNFEVYGSNKYCKIIHIKFEIIKNALEINPFILYLDCDAISIHEITQEFYEKYKHFDIVFQNDTYPQGLEDDFHVCCGIMIIRDTNATKSFINKILDIQEKNSNMIDQSCVYEYFNEIGINNLKELFNCTGLRLINAPWNVFMAGAYVRDKIANPDENTFLFHANHVTSKMNKIRLLKRVGEWNEINP